MSLEKLLEQAKSNNNKLKIELITKILNNKYPLKSLDSMIYVYTDLTKTKGIFTTNHYIKEHKNKVDKLNTLIEIKNEVYGK